jgi:hypothetical protein
MFHARPKLSKYEKKNERRSFKCPFPVARWMANAFQNPYSVSFYLCMRMYMLFLTSNILYADRHNTINKRSPSVAPIATETNKMQKKKLFHKQYEQMSTKNGRRTAPATAITMPGNKTCICWWENQRWKTKKKNIVK